MSASFYASPTIGATTTVAVFFHEIPHEGKCWVRMWPENAMVRVSQVYGVQMC